MSLAWRCVAGQVRSTWSWQKRRRLFRPPQAKRSTSRLLLYVSWHRTGGPSRLPTVSQLGVPHAPITPPIQSLGAVPYTRHARIDQNHGCAPYARGAIRRPHTPSWAPQRSHTSLLSSYTGCPPLDTSHPTASHHCPPHPCPPHPGPPSHPEPPRRTPTTPYLPHPCLQVPDVPGLVLCDCPGLVYPSVASSKGDMICDGILPIDQVGMVPILSHPASSRSVPTTPIPYHLTSANP